MMDKDKPKLLILSSDEAKRGPHSLLLQFVRQHSSILKSFDIHATEGTGSAILSTGMYTRNEITVCNRGLEGGIVEMAAMVARGECSTVIFLSDPTDTLWAETYALQRVCRVQKVRLVTTLAGAEQWAVYEAEEYLREHRDGVHHHGVQKWRPLNWREGKSNADRHGGFLSLSVEEQTLALISHDKKKEEMVSFVSKHIDFLSRFERILTTGTTGFLLKLLFCDEIQHKSITEEARQRLEPSRYKKLEEMLQQSIQTLQEEKAKESPSLKMAMERPTVPNRTFVEKVMPLPSGPDGGDILIAEQMLKNQCHTVIFFFDPDTAHAHDPDIRLFERTSLVRQVYATCVSDPDSADLWARTFKNRLGPRQRPQVSLEKALKTRYHLLDALILWTDNDDERAELAASLARLCAGYLCQWLVSRCGMQNRIGIGQGRTVSRILEEFISMQKCQLVKRTEHPNSLWYPVVTNIEGNIMMSGLEASAIANKFSRHFGGSSKAFIATGFEESSAERIPNDVQLMTELSNVDLVLVSATPWRESSALYQRFSLKDKLPPLPAKGGPVGLLSAIFLDQDGNERTWGYRAVGLGHSELRELASKGAVVLICGSANRKEVALAALRGGLVSVLITTRPTATWLLEQNVQA